MQLHFNWEQMEVFRLRRTAKALECPHDWQAFSGCFAGTIGWDYEKSNAPDDLIHVTCTDLFPPAPRN